VNPAWIKVCGVTTVQDGCLVEALGADAIGMTLVPDDPRSLRLDQAAEIAATVTIETVLVVQDADPELLRRAILTISPSRLQVDRTPPPEDSPPPIPWYRSFRCGGRQAISALKDYPGDRFLLRVDQPLLPPGPAWQRDRSLLKEIGRMGAMVLGGLPDLQRLDAALDRTRPWGVELREAVEQEPGVIDRDALVEALRSCGRR